MKKNYKEMQSEIQIIKRSNDPSVLSCQLKQNDKAVNSFGKHNSISGTDCRLCNGPPGIAGYKVWIIYLESSINNKSTKYKFQSITIIKNQLHTIKTLQS